MKGNTHKKIRSGGEDSIIKIKQILNRKTKKGSMIIFKYNDEKKSQILNRKDLF